MRAQPPAALNLKGAPTNSSYKESPPLTPPYRIRTKGGRASKAQNVRPTPRETYMDGLTDGEPSNARGIGGNEQSPNGRISHDLSLAENPRHSVVDNMLMSLNPELPRYFSSSSIPKPPQSSGSQTSSTRSLRHRGHLPSSSSASDTAYTIDNSPSRFATHFNRGRRSNSSSNFQSSLGRIDSVRPSEDHGPTRRSNALLAQRAGTADRSSVPKSRAGRKTSKSSGSSSVDLGQMVGNAKWGNTLHRRSSSFDDGQRKQVSPRKIRQESAPAVPRVNPAPLRYPSSEVAPTPTVPSGPSNRDPSPAIPGRAPYPNRQAAFLQHKGSHDSMTANKLKKDRGNGQDTIGMRLGRSKSPEKTRGSQRTGLSQHHTSSKLGSRVDSRAASPTRGLSEAAPSLRQQVETPRERPGFFRRVFGSSRHAAPPGQDLRPPQLHSARNCVRADSRASFVPPDTVQPPGATEDGIHASAQRVHPTVTKKASSFFRRRKKSISEPESSLGSVQLPPHIASNDPSQPSPSLRQVMDPFLYSPSAAKTERNRVLRDKGPQESGGSMLTAASQKPPLRNASSTQHSLHDIHKAGISSEPLESSAPRGWGNLNPSPDSRTNDNQLHPPTDSFLHDTSSAEERTLDTDSLKAPSQDGAMVPSRSANRFPVDPSYDKERDPRLLGSRSYSVDKAPTAGASSKLSTVDRNNLSRSSTPKHLSSHDFLTTAQTNPIERTPSPAASNKGSDRVWLQPTVSDEALQQSVGPKQSVEVPEVSPISDYHSASSTADKDEFATEGKQIGDDPDAPDGQAETPKLCNESEPTPDDCELASRVYYGDETLVEKSKAAAWLGDEGPERIRVRHAFMDKFDWQNMNILAALRNFCARILLKGETQQVDRLLDSFSARWCVCNADHGFKAKDVVHTICYSLLLLNTDLHVAEIEAKMTRTQFLRNTMPTIRRVVVDAAPDAFENKRASTLPMNTTWTESAPSDQPKEPAFPRTRSSTEGKRSFEGQRPVYRLSQRPSDQSPLAYSSNSVLSPLDYDAPNDDCGPLVKASFRGKMSTWEVQVEIVLKNFYNSIRQQRLPLHMAESREMPIEAPQPPSSLSTMTGNMLRRTPSMLSKAGSEHMSFRGRASEQRFGTGRWTSKSRQRPRLYPASTVGSSRTSLDEPQSSMWSPAGSSTWSKYSFGRTQTSMSVESFGSSFPDSEYQQSIGFANALSQAIIREEAGTSDAIEETMRAAPLLGDESLELAGAPWAKEGILKHKHHLDAVDKKSKDRNWVESFAVIEKGCLRLFSFSMNAKSMRQKMRTQKLPGGVVGGGNWMDNAEALGQFSLRQTLASALPPPGYSKTRPHVWALSFPTGAVHLFQVGTPDIVKEFVTTANYWAARLSKEPLVGGVSNIEYGWGDSVVNSALLASDMPPPPPTTSTGHRPSLQSSIRSSLDQGSSKPKLPGDKANINDWMPPQQSMVASVLMEVDQLRALVTYVKNVENELQRHNELRPAMLIAVSISSDRFHPNQKFT